MREKPSIVLANGSSSIKAGFSQDDVPLVVLPNMLGKQKYPSWLSRCELLKSDSSSLAWMAKSKVQDTFIGDEAQEFRGILDLTYPVNQGIVQDWEAMEQIWNFTFEKVLEMSSDSSKSLRNRKVLLTESPLNPPQNREKMLEIMFDTFKTRGVYIENPTLLEMMASASLTALVLHIGDTVTLVSAFYQGYEIFNATQRTHVAGREVTKYLKNLLSQNNKSRNDFQSFDLGVIQQIKEKAGLVAQEDEFYEDFKVKLPDGSSCTLSSERFQCFEALFDPSLVGLHCQGVHMLLSKCLEACEIDVRKELLSNIIVSGGTAATPGFIERLKSEIKFSFPTCVKFNVDERKSTYERLYASWIGGSTLSSLTSFQDNWISRAEYNEVGSSIAARKCYNYGF